MSVREMKSPPAVLRIEISAPWTSMLDFVVFFIGGKFQLMSDLFAIQIMRLRIAMIATVRNPKPMVNCPARTRAPMAKMIIGSFRL